ncbi:calcineurin-like phosphoesterase [Vibrio splendidus]|nr:calcineurin-like phosphoesterase [Vibrio splendidus]
MQPCVLILFLGKLSASTYIYSELTVLRLIHFSDIHLRSPYCDNPETDDNIHIRDRVHKDITKLIKVDGKKVDALLITGDIAFAGKGSEYNAARTWLDELQSTLELPNDRILIVPGNHDVDRNAADEYLSKAIRERIESKSTSWEREQAIQEALRSTHADNAILAPMKNYIEFSSNYGCEISAIRPFWTQRLDLSELVSIEFRGITTPLFSNKEDRKGSLVLGKKQFNFRNLPGILNVSLMHHPCDWLIDSDEFEDLLTNNVHIQLFGHKHRARWSNTDDVLTIHSISLHPERDEPGYEPGYNIIDISEKQVSEDECTVNVKVVVRNLQTSPQIFTSKIFPGGRSYFTKEIALTINHTPILGTSESTHTLEENKTIECQSATNILDKVSIAPTPTKDIKQASRVFSGLDRSHRDQILIDCDILEQHELTKPDVEKQQIAFQRAIEQGKQDLLHDTIMTKGKA